MKKTYFLSTLVLFFLLFSCKKDGAQQMPPLTIAVTDVLQQDVRLESEYTGQTYGKSDIQINPRVDGVVESMNFKEGSVVTKGQLLYSIDDLPFKEKLHQAEGNLAEVEATLANSKSDYDMMMPLAKINAVSQRELISAKSKYNASLADLKAAKAQLENAKIQLGYCRILAPISGLIGISSARVGDYVSSGSSTVLNTISDLGEVRVRFTMNEQEFLRIFREVSKDKTSLKEAGQTLSLKLSDGSLYPQKGKVSFADRQIDPTTGAITFEALFANPDKLIRPGQFVTIGFVTEVRKQALLIPQRSVNEMQGIYQVYVLGDSSKVRMQIVKIGASYLDGYVVEDGLKAGEKVAIAGTSLLQNGSVITPKNTPWQPGEPQIAPTK